MSDLALLQNPSIFLENFAEHIALAKKRVFLQAMVVESGEVLDSIAPLLISAAARGVDVRVYFDWVTQRYLHGDIRLIPVVSAEIRRLEQLQHERNQAMWKRLSEGGVSVVEMNRPLFGKHAFPVMGRNHIKIYAVDDIAWMGGLNFFDNSFRNLDFMVRFDERTIVAALCDQFVRVNDHRPEDDYLKKVGAYGALIVDSGKQGKSLIYEQAYQMVLGAQKEVVFASQLVPENRMLDLLLAKSENGVQVVVYTSHPEDSTFTKYPLRYFYTTFRDELENTKNSIRFIHLDKKIHAKLLIVDGKEAMFGSHNFVESGVRMGTQEISLRTSNQALVGQLLQFVEVLKTHIPKR